MKNISSAERRSSAVLDRALLALVAGLLFALTAIELARVGYREVFVRRPAEAAALLAAGGAAVVLMQKSLRKRLSGTGDAAAAENSSSGAAVDDAAALEALRRYELLAEHSQELVLFIAGRNVAEMKVADANAAAATAYGYERREIEGLAIERPFDKNTIAACRWAFETRSLAPVTFEAEHRRSGGAKFPVEVSVFSTDGADDEPLVVVMVRDITLRKRRLASERLLHEVDRRILRHEPLDAILTFACTELAKLYEFPLVQLSLKAESGEVSIRKWAGESPEFLDDIEVRYDDTPEGAGPTGTAIRTGEPQIRDLITDPGFSRWRERALAYGFRKAIAFPLAASEQVLGALTLFMKDAQAFDDENVNVLTTFVDQIALSIVAAREHDQLELQRVALESAANAVVVTDAEGQIQWVNPAFTRLTAYRADEAIGRKPSILKSGNHSEAFYRQMWSALAHGRVWSGEIYNRRKDGTLYIEEQSITPVKGDDGRIAHYVAIKQDITARKKQEEEIRHLAMHDALTNLPNRRSLEAAMERLCRQNPTAPASSVLILDVDNFKPVNDSVGHPAGDQLLADVAHLLHESLRPTDFLARLGGDEFAVLLPESSGAQALEVAERLRHNLDAYRFHYAGMTFDITISIGVAPVDGTVDAATVMVRADSALYAAKQQGKNRTVAWPFGEEEGMRLAAASRWATRIKDAMRDDRLLLHFQPIVNLTTGRAEHFEALLRLVDTDGTVVAANEFVPAAERFGLMPQVDRWVVERVLELLAGPLQERIFVNISGASLCDQSLLELVVRRVTEAELPPGRLAFEITESAAVSDLRRAQSWIAKLKNLGCLFALDDFGIGFSSFSYLRVLPADYVKIDRSFVAELDTNPTNRALVQAVKSVANALGKDVIAEGVETEQQAVALRELGIELGQGFRWGVPRQEISAPAPEV